MHGGCPSLLAAPAKMVWIVGTWNVDGVNPINWFMLDPFEITIRGVLPSRGSLQSYPKVKNVFAHRFKTSHRLFETCGISPTYNPECVQVTLYIRVQNIH